MRYLKYFESSEENTQMGITTDEVKECFYDLSDEGWVVNVRFSKRMMNAKVDSLAGKISMDLIPSIEIKIHKKFPEKVFTQELMGLQESEVYKGCVELLNGRLSEYDLFIEFDKIERVQHTDGSQIFILIYRKSDENLISKPFNFDLSKYKK
jgi:hypothetical protein